MPPRRKGNSNGEFHFVDVHVGARLLRRRKQLGIPIQSLAGIIGLSFQQIQKYESAANRISPGRLYLFARALAVPVEWFFDGLPPTATRRAATVIPEYELESRETASLDAAYFRLPPDRRRAILQVLRSMTGTPSGERRF
jgi:transcriptional regulator with XRE-family HTH domain